MQALKRTVMTRTTLTTATVLILMPIMVMVVAPGQIARPLLGLRTWIQAVACDGKANMQRHLLVRDREHSEISKAHPEVEDGIDAQAEPARGRVPEEQSAASEVADEAAQVVMKNLNDWRMAVIRMGALFVQERRHFRSPTKLWPRKPRAEVALLRPKPCRCNARPLRHLAGAAVVAAAPRSWSKPWTKSSQSHNVRLSGSPVFESPSSSSTANAYPLGSALHARPTTPTACCRHS